MDIVNRDRLNQLVGRAIIRYHLKCGHQLLVQGGRLDIMEIDCPECDPHRNEQIGYIEYSEEDNPVHAE